MIGKKRVAPFLVALLLAAAAASSQPAGDTDSEQVIEQEEPAATSGAGENNTDTAPRPPERSPTDYRASEQISEDLSVSFPVDI